jgi:hypothetical protein
VAMRSVADRELLLSEIAQLFSAYLTIKRALSAPVAEPILYRGIDPGDRLPAIKIITDS